jgi:hypothetical protein
MVCVFVSVIFSLDDDGASVYGSNYNDSSCRSTEDANREWELASNPVCRDRRQKESKSAIFLVAGSGLMVGSTLN